MCALFFACFCTLTQRPQFKYQIPSGGKGGGEKEETFKNFFHKQLIGGQMKSFQPTSQIEGNNFAPKLRLTGYLEDVRKGAKGQT